MLPIIAGLLTTLAQNGLTTLAGAIQAKGKEVIEDKLGVKIPENPSPADLLKLKQLENEHEEFLINASIRQQEQDLASFKVEVEDRGSARDRDVKLAQAGYKNNRADLMFFLAVVMVACLVWIVWKDSGINEYVKGIFTLVLGRFLGYLDNIYNFEFGTTRGSKDKDATIQHLSGGSK